MPSRPPAARLIAARYAGFARRAMGTWPVAELGFVALGVLGTRVGTARDFSLQIRQRASAAERDAPAAPG